MSTPARRKAHKSKPANGAVAAHLPHAPVPVPMPQSAPTSTPPAAGDVDMDDAYHLLEEMPPSDPMASGGSFMDMIRDDAGTDDISISLPYEQEGYAEQNGFDIPTPTGKKAWHAKHCLPTTQHKKMRH